MAHAKNMAHRLGIIEGADILCNLDADNFTGPGFASYIAEQMQAGDRSCGPTETNPARSATRRDATAGS